MSARTIIPEHEAAMDWAGAFSLRLEAMDAASIRRDWNQEPATTHRAQLKKTGAPALQNLVDHVRWRLDDLARLASLAETEVV